jgi:hypothetical protein
MNKIKITIFFLSIFISFSTEAFFVANKSPYEVTVEFCLPNGEHDAFLTLPAGGLTTIRSCEDPQLPHFSEYMLNIVFMQGKTPVYHSFLGTPLANIGENMCLLFSTDCGMEFIAATAAMKLAIKNTSLVPLSSVPFFWSGAKIKVPQGSTNLS